MIVAAYELELYCDNEDKIKHPYGYFPHSFVGHTRGGVFKQARAKGWIINYQRDRAICPLCSKKKPKL